MDKANQHGFNPTHPLVEMDVASRSVHVRVGGWHIGWMVHTQARKWVGGHITSMLWDTTSILGAACGTWGLAHSGTVAPFCAVIIAVQYGSSPSLSMYWLRKFTYYTCLIQHYLGAVSLMVSTKYITYMLHITEYLLSNETPTFQPGNFQNVYFITEYHFYPLFLMSKLFVYDHTSYLSVYLVFCSCHNQNILCKLFVMVTSLTCKCGPYSWMNKHTYWMQNIICM